MSKPKKHLLIFVDWYLPGYKAGGPIRSVSNLAKVLKDDFKISIITSDKDFGVEEPYDDIHANKWIQREEGQVIYLNENWQNGYQISALIDELRPDIIYFNSFFSRIFTLIPLRIFQKQRHKPALVLAPRGMLAKNALKLKGFKKQVFIRVAKLNGWYKGITWHASTEAEANEVKAVFGKNAKVQVARNIALLEKAQVERPVKRVGEARFFFLARITKMKNLLEAISYFEKLEPAGKVTFDIFGPIDDAPYWQACQQAIAKVKNVEIQYRGEVAHHQISEEVQQQHFLVLPTLNENYGHVIVECMACGAPVVISDRTPWRKLSEKQAGWDVKLHDEAAFIETLEKCISMDALEYKTWSTGAETLGSSVLCNPTDVDANRQLFINA